MKRIFVIACCAILLTSCHENLEDRAAREAKEYTEKFCPTPVNNFTRTDSVVFEKDTKTYHYYCTLTGLMDNLDKITMHQKEIHDALAKSIKESTNINAYKEAGFNFEYTCRSEKNSKLILFQAIYSSKDYNK